MLRVRACSLSLPPSFSLTIERVSAGMLYEREKEGGRERERESEKEGENHSCGERDFSLSLSMTDAIDN